MDIVIPDDSPPTYASLDQADLLRLAPWGRVRLFTTRATTPRELFDRIAPAAVLINVRSYTLLDDEALSHAPNLKLISILGTGTDNIDLVATHRRGITVTNTPGAGAPSVAELTLGLMLAVTRAIPLSDSRLREGAWQHFEGPELAGKTLGLIGLGRIGQYVARLGHGLGMRVIAWSFSNDPARAERLGIELVDRDDVFRLADVVSLHVRNTPAVRGMVGQRELGLMKPSAYLINTARGALVDEAALADALRTGQIAGAGLDVFTEEPLPLEANPFRELSNVVLTPHIGAVTFEANTRSRALPVDNIIAFLGGQPQNVVEP